MSNTCPLGSSLFDYPPSNCYLNVILTSSHISKCNPPCNCKILLDLSGNCLRLCLNKFVFVAHTILSGKLFHRFVKLTLLSRLFVSQYHSSLSCNMLFVCPFPVLYLAYNTYIVFGLTGHDWLYS